ncbi:ABC transporter substrate-binding protein [Leifsonia lichenia]
MTFRKTSSGRRVTALAATIAATALLLAGCASSTPAATSTAGGASGVYRIPITDPGGDIDPLTAADYNAMLLTGLASEGLISLNAKGTLVPRLATSWKPSDDGLSWTVKLRAGAEFNDGKPVTAKDVVSTFQAIIGPDSKSPGKSSFDGILTSAAAGPDDESVVFTLARPFSDFPRLLTGANTAILPAGYTPGDWLKHPVGAGQFVLDQFTPGQGATFSRNPKYWDAKDIKVAGVELKVYSDTQAELLAFQAAEIDRIDQSSEVAAAVKASDYTEVSSGYNKFDGIFLNVTAAPFTDPKVRQAVAWAIDRKGLVKNVYGGNAVVANDTTYFPDYPVQPEGLTQREKDAGKVADLLGGKTVSFDITTDNKLYGEVLQQQLNAVPGFTVGLKVLTSAQYYADGADSPWLNAPLTITNWAVRAPSQYISLIFTAGAAWNASHYSNPQLEATSAAYDKATDEATRQKLVNQIASTQWNDLAVIVPTIAKAKVLQNKRVHGQFPGALDFYTGYSFAGITITG